MTLNCSLEGMNARTDIFGSKTGFGVSAVAAFRRAVPKGGVAFLLESISVAGHVGLWRQWRLPQGNRLPGVARSITLLDSQASM